jgi:hypothetical protein
MPILMPDKYKNGPKSKFSKDTYAGGSKKEGSRRMPDDSEEGNKGKKKVKGKKMSRAEFLKMVREKKYKKK